MKTIRFCCILVGISLAFCGNAAELGRSTPEVIEDFHVSTSARAGRISGNKATGLQLALFSPAQVFPESYDVYGLRLNILYGRNQNLRGFDCGVVNVGDGLMEGFQLGAANKVNELAGVQIGAYNAIGASVDGSFQLGALNQSFEFMGLQLGAINYAQNIQGAQIGLINVCDTINGIQIGVFNIISSSEFLIFCPLFNAQF